MDQHPLTTLTRTLKHLPTRRDVVRGLAGAGLGLSALRISDLTEAKKGKRNKKHKRRSCKPNCHDRSCGNDGCGGSCGACVADQICHGGTCCTPQRPAATCVGRCGAWPNNCGQSVSCAMCPANALCLPSGSCANVCVTPTDCPMFNCACANSVEGLRHCVNGSSLSCTAMVQACTTTADCPVGASCIERPCGPGGSAQWGCISLDQCGS
jgi:hypothetical protein